MKAKRSQEGMAHLSACYRKQRDKCTLVFCYKYNKNEVSVENPSLGKSQYTENLKDLLGW